MDNEGRVRSLRGLTVLGQQGCRQKGSGLIQHGRKAVPVQPFFLKTDHQLCDSSPLPCRQQTAQLHARLRAFLFHGDGGMELQLHAPGTERLQDHGRIFRTEEECRVGRAFLYDLQQYVLVLLCQNGAVRKDIDLPGTLVGPDIGIGADLADGVHGEVLMGLVPDGDNVRVNAGEHLAAGGTCPAGLLSAALTLHGRSSVLRGGDPVPAAGKQQRVGKCSPSGGFPDPPGNGVIGKFHWTASLLSRFPQKCGISIAYFTQKGKNRFSYQRSAKKFSIPY